MNRRKFLTTLLLGTPVVLASEQLLELLAPRKTILLPPQGGWPSLAEPWKVNVLGGYLYSRDLAKHLWTQEISKAVDRAVYQDLALQQMLMKQVRAGQARVAVFPCIED